MIDIHIGERIAILETELRGVLTRMEKVEGILDELKSTVWRATGAISILLLLVEVGAKWIGK